MSIKLKCICGAKYTLETSIAGRKARCKKCGRVLRVPTLMENDAMESLRKLPAYEGPYREELFEKLSQTASSGTDGRYYLEDIHYPSGSLSLCRAQDVAAVFSEKAKFKRNEEGKREMAFFEKTEPRTLMIYTRKEREISFDFGVIGARDDPQNCWYYYKVDPNLYLGVAVGSVQADPSTDEDEKVMDI